MRDVKIYMFAIKFQIIHRFNTVKSLAYINPVVTDKGKMYNNWPRSLGRGHQSVPRSPFIIIFFGGVN